jgi:uncharacterized protein
MGIYLTYGALCCAIGSNWISKRVNRNKIITVILFLISLISGITFGYVELYSGATALLLFCMAYLYFEKTGLRWFGFVVFTIMTVMLAAHKFPGFNNYNVVKDIKITADSMKYSLYFNFDKGMAGFFILFFLKDLIKSLKELIDMLKKSVLPGFIGISVIIVLSFVLGYIKFEPKLPDFIWSFIVSNMFFTCIAEELFFRKIVQDNLKKLFNKIGYGKLFGVVLSALLFGSVHLIGGIKYFFLAFTAGLFYAYVYEKTEKVESAILIHFLLNLTHILLFTYPALG